MITMRRSTPFLIVFLLFSVQPVFSQTKLFIEQGVLSIESKEGKVYTRHKVRGAEFAVSPEVRIRIDDVIEKKSDAEQPLFFYELSALDPASQTWQPFCIEDPQGERLALFYYGTMNEKEGYRPSGQISITCSAGVIAKCITWGYSPYSDHPDAVARHNACLRMARADYCGNGQPYTRNGTMINMYDNAGIQKSDATAAENGLVFEAAWNENGAMCVHHPRIPENIDLKKLIAACPEKFSTANTGASCSKEKYPDALIYNDSRPGSLD